jgi:dTMP kinase
MKIEVPVMSRGKFIVFEGLDGSGKTTQLNSLYNYISKEKNIKCKKDYEPSDGLLGAMARAAIKKRVSFEPQTMALLFAADRYEHIKNDIIPHLEGGIHVLCDRYVLSNLAYQGLALDCNEIYEYNKASINLLFPDLTVFIDTDPAETAERIGKSRIGNELFDEHGAAVRQSFHKAIEQLTEKGILNESNLLIIKGNRPEEIINREIIKYIDSFFK